MPMTRGQSGQLKRAFLETFRRLGNVSSACALSGVARQRIYEWRKEDAEFKEAFADAEIEATEVMEAEARRRAVEGTRRLKFHEGVAVRDPETDAPYVELEYSDTLLMFLLKARAPEKYKDRHEFRGEVGGALHLSGQIQFVPLVPPEAA